MSASIAFDNGRGQPQKLTFANNLKLALAIQFSSDMKLDIIEDKDHPCGLVRADIGFSLFDANAVLRYVMNDYSDLKSDAYKYAVESLETLLWHEDISQHGKECVKKALENYLTDLQDPISVTKLILWADTYSLDSDQQSKSIKTLPKPILNAISIALARTSRDSSKFKHTGATSIAKGHEVKLQTQDDGKILPKDGERNILITSALPYVNNVPHLGNIVGSVLSADIFARYSKTRNYNTLFICGTDEYGTATETKAIEEGVTPRQLCDKYHAIHSDVYKWFQIDFDYFGRTTTDKQTEIAQEIFMSLYDNGYLEEQAMKQLYCPEHNSFLADRYVEGECPKCHYEDARGDQCDKCGGLLDPFELINPHCKLDNASPVPKISNHIFLSLDKLEEKVASWVNKSAEEGQWSKNSKTITNSWLKDGLNPRCITRDLVWGTPVPLDGFKDKVLYVWFDATIGYVSITANYTDEWKQWWKNPDKVDLYQFMGKDNVPFHTVVFPATEIGTNDKWTMLHHLNTTEYLQYEGGKFSKSRGVGVFGNNAKDSQVPASVWRYYLASIRPESSDSQFSWNDFVARNNSELLANLGNFVNRLIKFVNAKYNGVVPDFNALYVPQYETLVSEINAILGSYVDEMEFGHERKGLELAMSLSARGNQFLQENKLDNSLFDKSPEKSDAVVAVGLNMIYTVASLIYPFMPETANSIYKMLNAPKLRIPDLFELVIQKGHNINKAEYLFKRIEEDKIEMWRSQYGGQQK